MDGIERITARILDDAREQIADINTQTTQKVDQLQEQYARQADREGEEILSQGRAEADRRRERLITSAAMERRKLELGARQQVLDEAFALALDKLCSLPEEDYVAVLAAMAVRAARTGREQLIFSAADRARGGKRVVMAANEARQPWKHEGGRLFGSGGPERRGAGHRNRPAGSQRADPANPGRFCHE